MLGVILESKTKYDFYSYYASRGTGSIYQGYYDWKSSRLG